MNECAFSNNCIDEMRTSIRLSGEYRQKYRIREGKEEKNYEPIKLEEVTYKWKKPLLVNSFIFGEDND